MVQILQRFIHKAPICGLMGSKWLNRSCVQGAVLVSLLCFLLGFAVQVFFHVLPSNSLTNLRDHNHFVIDGKVVDVTAEDIRNIANAGLTTAKVEPDIGAKEVHEMALPAVAPKNNEPLLSLSGMNNVPNIVSAWRNAKLDWHQLVPTHSSLWERFGIPKGEGKLPLLINKETLITDYLTRYHESGLSSMYGHEYGSMEAYSGCNVFRSSCVIHDETKCRADQLCQWSVTNHVCVDVTDAKEDNNATPATCFNPKVVTENGFTATNAASCRHWVQQPAVLVTMDSESQSMFYHFWASWSGLVKFWKNKLDSRRDVHFFLSKINDPMFLQFFGLLSDNCWRRAGFSYNPADVCYCNTHTYQSSQARDGAVEAAQQMLTYLGLQDTKPPVDKVKIGLISRRRKRFILNEYALAQHLATMGYEYVILPLEEMTLFEQMQQLRSVDVLVGMHGSGLDNSVFLHPGSVLIQLLPYKVEHRCTFSATAATAGVTYMEWQLKDPTQAVFHWDLLLQANANALDRMSQQQYLDRGQQRAGDRETLMFWINQDIVVPLNEWENLIRNAVQKSNAHKRGLH